MIVAFSGPKGAGKSTAMRAVGPMSLAEFDAGTVGKAGFVHVYFASVLKSMLAVIDPALLDHETKEVPSDILCGKTPRWAMQSLGTEWGRNCIGENLWVNAWARTADRVLNAGRFVVVDDLRFPNEYEAVKEREGIVIEVKRPGFQRSTEHASEAWAPPADHIVMNDGTPADLERAVREIVRQHNP